MRVVFLVIILSFLLAGGLLAQDTNNPQVRTQNQTTDDVIELEVSEIKITIEKPQVTLFSDRIKPEFDDTNLEKSFYREIVGEGEKFVFDFKNSKEPVDQINIKQLLNVHK
ncbi:MAG: hypothetical protein AB7W47_12485 [Calditrichaceae bacterium]